jgi:hypothetical protein
MADAFNLSQLGNLPPELYEQQQALNRQQQMAAMLMQQGQQAPQGQMISGRYVAPSFTQNLASLAQTGVGAYLQNKGDKQALELATKLREGKLGTQQALMEALNAGDTKKALSIATADQYGAGKEFIPALIGSVIPKTPEKVAEYNIAKAEGFKGTLNDYLQQMTPYQKQSLALQAANQNKPQIVETANGYVAINPNNPSQAMPVMAGGQPLMGTKGALPEGANKQVTGATNLKSAIDNYKETLKGFTTLDMANPDARAGMGNAYNNMMLQAKEAYNLGVLNGPDYAILQSVVKDPTKLGSLLTSKKALEKQATDLGKQADVIIENVYKTHNRNVPASLQTMPSAAPATTNKAQNFDPALLQYMTPEQQALFSKPGK